MIKSRHPLDLFLGMDYKLLGLEHVRLSIPSPRSRNFIVVEHIKRAEGKKKYTLCVLIKRGVDTFTAIRILSRELGINARDIGFAGLKDANATTLQYVTLPIVQKKHLVIRLANEKIIVLNCQETVSFRLKRGYIHYNEFIVRAMVREEDEILKLHGRPIIVPNYYGYQRFGTRRPNTHILGYFLAKHDLGNILAELLDSPYPDESPANIVNRLNYKPTWGYERQIHQCISKGLIRSCLTKAPLNIMLEALQAYMFNKYLSIRLEEYGVDRITIPIRGERIIDGYPHAPLIGAKVKLKGDVRRIYEYIAEEINIRLDDVMRSLKGAYRPILIRTELKIHKVDQGLLLLKFKLPPASYATTVLREFTENPYTISY